MQIIRLGFADDATSEIVKRVQMAVADAPLFDLAPAIFISGIERRARNIEQMVGASFLRGTPEKISRELLGKFMPQLTIRGSVERDFDFFGALSSTLSDLGQTRRASRALVEQLIEARKRLAENYAPEDRNDDALRALGSRGELLSGVLSAYAQRLQLTQTIDQEDAPWLAANGMPDWKDFTPKLLVIEELSQIRPARARFLKALIERAEQTVVVTREGTEYSQEATETLLGMLPKPPQEVSLPDCPKAKFQFEVARILSEQTDAIEQSEGLELRKSFSRATEVRDTAQEIKQAVLAGVSPKDIAVVAPSMRVYDALINETFRAAGIPFDSASDTPLDVIATVSPILDLIRCARNGLDRLELLDALASPYLRFTAKSDVTRLRWLGRIESATRKANIVGGRSLQKDWAHKLEATELRSKDFGDKEKLTKRLSEILKLLQPFAWSSAKASSFIEAISKLIEASGASEVLATDAPDDTRGMRGEALFRFKKLLRDLASEFKKVGDPTLKCSEIFQALLEQCRSHSVRQSEQKGELVQVFGMRELQLSKFEIVFVLGLTDVDLPLSEAECMFFPPVRDKLVESVFDQFADNLHTPINTALQADHLYAHMLLAVNKKLVLSMPESEGDTPMVPAVIHARMMKFHGYEKARNLPCLAQPLPVTGTELASMTAKVLGGGGEFSAELALSESVRVGLHGRVVDLRRNDETTNPGHYGGQVKAFPQLEKEYGLTGEGRHVFSPSQIDLYASCPMRFWFRYVVRIKKEDDPTIEPPASEIGTFVHTVFERFIWRLREHVGMPATVDDPKRREAVNLIEIAGSEDAGVQLGTELLLQAFKDAQGTMVTEGPYWQGTLECLESDLVNESSLGKGALRAFLEEELKRGREGIGCRFVEFTFGKNTEADEDECRDNVPEVLELTLPNGSIILQGSVDRVDESADGLEIVDYKTGKAKSQNEVRDGKAFQLPTYLAAIAAKTETIPAGMSYLQARLFKPFARIDIANGGRKPLDVPDLVDRQLPTRLEKMLTAISSGVFIHLPFEKPANACAYCEYSTACAKNETLQAERQKRMRELVPEAYVAGPVAVVEPEGGQ
ncbi:PD-(D/E)XK nuclease family protein [Planctomycetota bacterium]|nr:PD-(D/E)XK nuclease family protein [Planctomycetota bacterium]